MSAGKDRLYIYQNTMHYLVWLQSLRYPSNGSLVVINIKSHNAMDMATRLPYTRIITPLNTVYHSSSDSNKYLHYWFITSRLECYKYDIIDMAP
jgi:hypothetical protein